MKETLTRVREKASGAASGAAERGRELLPSFLEQLIDRFRSAQVLLHGAGLASYGLISLAPFLVVAFWVVGAVVGEERVEDLAGNLSDMAPGDVDAQPLIEDLLEVGTGVGLVALLLALLLAMPVLLLGALAAFHLLTGAVDDGIAAQALVWVAAVVVGAAVTATGIGGIYLLFGPDQLSWRSFALGAGIASLLIAATSSGYLVYLDQGADWEERVAGSGLATVVLLALWLYLSNVILLAGYAAALEWDDRRGNRDEDPQPD